MVVVDVVRVGLDEQLVERLDVVPGDLDGLELGELPVVAVLGQEVAEVVEGRVELAHALALAVVGVLALLPLLDDAEDARPRSSLLRERRGRGRGRGRGRSRARRKAGLKQKKYSYCNRAYSGTRIRKRNEGAVSLFARSDRLGVYCGLRIYMIPHDHNVPLSNSNSNK